MKPDNESTNIGAGAGWVLLIQRYGLWGGGIMAVTILAWRGLVAATEIWATELPLIEKILYMAGSMVYILFVFVLVLTLIYSWVCYTRSERNQR